MTIISPVRRFIGPLMALLLSAGWQTAADAATASLLPNGNFESDTKAQSWPDGWARPKSGGSWETEEGNHFLRLVSSSPGQMAMLYQAIRLPADVRALELTWRWRCSDLKPGKQMWFDARIMMDFKDASGTKVGPGPAAPNLRKSTDGWVTRTMRFLVPAGATTLEFMPALFQVESGTLDFDDFSLTPTDPAPLEVEAAAKAVANAEKLAKMAASRRARAASVLEKEGTLLSNGDFESDNKKGDQWPDDWSHPQGTSWEQEEGNHFLRLKVDEPNKTVLTFRSFDIPEGVKALELTWRQRVSDLKVGKEPWFDARFMMDFKDAAGKKLKPGPGSPNTRRNTDGWVDRKSSFLVPEGALTLDFMATLFQVQKGTFDIDNLVIKPTDAEVLLAAMKAAEAQRKAAEVPAEAAQKDKWPQALHVEGTQVLTPDGTPVMLQGVNVVSLEWSVAGEQVMKASKVAVEQWNANIIRLPVTQKWWFGQGSGQKDGGASYRQRVDEVITLIANRGKYVLLDLHQFGAPRQEHADFWKDAAAKYKDHPAVLFDLFNEPHGVSWEVWRNGGEIPQKKKPGEEDSFISDEDKAKAAAARQSIGMQKLLDTVRETGARNVVLVGGLDYAYDLSGIANGYALKDNGGAGIILSTHIYPWKHDWTGKVLCVVDKYPILVGEVGAGAKKMDWLPAASQEEAVTWVPAMLGFMQKYKMHWTAFAFHPKAGPAMLEDWTYTPNTAWGVFAKRALAGEKFELDKLR